MLTKRNIYDILSRRGVRPGDSILVHSSLRSIGLIEGGPDALIDGLMEVVGPAGTLLMPAFNYTRPLPSPYFDPRTTPSRAGALTEIFRNRPGTQRSLHPTHSVAAQGKRAEEFLADHHKNLAFGIGSPIDRLSREGGYVLLIGVTHLANSCIHVGESHARVKKFYWVDGPLPIAKLLLPDGEILDYPLDCSSSCSKAFNSVEYPLRRKNLIIDLTLGNAICFLMKGIDVIETIVQMIREEPLILHCNREDCRPCVLSRREICGN